MDRENLPKHVYAECDLATVEDKLIDVIEETELGEFDGKEIGPKGTTLYMYGADAEKLFTGIESVLRGYPLCPKARVIIRHGGPGANQREVTL